MSWVLDSLPQEEKLLALVALDSYQHFLSTGHVDDESRVNLGEEVFKTTLNQDVVTFGRYYLPHHFSHHEAKFHSELSKMLWQRKYLAAAAPRGHAKSTITTVAHVLHETAMRRAKFVVIIGNTQQTAADHLDAILGEIIENRKLIEDFPHLEVPDAAELRKERKKKKRQRQTDFVTRGGVRFIARGAGQPIRGAKEREIRPDLIILDDVDDDKTVRSETMRKHLVSWFDKVVMALEGVIDARIRIVGTVLHKHSLLSQMIRRWNGKIWKAVIDWETQQVQWPEVWGFNRLMVKRDGGHDAGKPIKGIGSIAFAQEYQNEPQEDSAHPMRREWIQRVPLIPDMLRQSGTVFIGVDLALSEKEKSSYNSLVVHIYDPRSDLTYVVDAVRWRATINETKRIIAHKVAFWKPALTAIEAVQFQTAVVQQMIEEMPMYLFAGITPDRDKAARFQVLANQYSLKKLLHLETDERLGDGLTDTWSGRLPSYYEDELLDFPDVENSDWCDGSVYAYLARFMPYGVQMVSTAVLIQDSSGADW